MAVIGWLCMVAAMLMVSAAFGLAALNNLGAYNIGGVPNSASKKALTILVAVVVLALWWLLIESAPFTVTVHAG